MNSLRLWHALNHPPTMHPLFWLTVERSVHSNRLPSRFSWVDRLSIAYLLVFGASILLVNALGTHTQSAFITILMLLLALPIIVPLVILLRSTVFSGSYHGLLWAIDISQFVTRERQNGTYDLLCLLPTGGLAAHWAICTGCLYRNQQFNRLLEMRGAILRVVLIFSAFIFLGLRGESTEEEGILFVLGVAALLAAMYVDFIHSIVLGGLVGMIAPLYTYNRTDARLWAAGIFLAIQVWVYGVTVFAGLMIAPRLFEGIGFRGWFVTALIPFVMVLVFTAVREIMIIGLWRWLLAQTNTDPHDLGRVFSFIP